MATRHQMTHDRFVLRMLTPAQREELARTHTLVALRAASAVAVQVMGECVVYAHHYGQRITTHADLATALQYYVVALAAKEQAIIFAARCGETVATVGRTYHMGRDVWRVVEVVTPDGTIYQVDLDARAFHTVTAARAEARRLVVAGSAFQVSVRAW